LKEDAQSNFTSVERIKKILAYDAGYREFK